MLRICYVHRYNFKSTWGDRCLCSDAHSLAPLFRGRELDPQMYTALDSDQFDTQYSYANSLPSYCNFEWHQSNFCKSGPLPKCGIMAEKLANVNDNNYASGTPFLMIFRSIPN